MNPRRVHDLMRDRFPSFDSAKVEWTNVVERSGPNLPLIKQLLERHISAPEVLVEVHRRIGTQLPREEAAHYISEHVGQGRIRAADREFTSFFVVELNGVAAGWRS